ncbi:TrbC/VirB2 family protein [Povalibacter sp.]|uniref:TrbC/VirB2 family protein n=1 Tax=Povalibacter sp. TaxID=1962978 RepID=UPI002F3EFB45
MAKRLEVVASSRLSVAVAGMLVSPMLAAQSVFDTGVNAVVAWAFVIATPVAVLIVMALGGAALVGKVSWSWAIGGLIGIGILFGSEQIVGWIRSLFGV